MAYLKPTPFSPQGSSVLPSPLALPGSFGFRGGQNPSITQGGRVTPLPPGTQEDSPLVHPDYQFANRTANSTPATITPAQNPLQLPTPKLKFGAKQLLGLPMNKVADALNPLPKVANAMTVRAYNDNGTGTPENTYHNEITKTDLGNGVTKTVENRPKEAQKYYMKRGTFYQDPSGKWVTPQVTVKFGDTGEEVGRLQLWLAGNGYLPYDIASIEQNKFGPATQAALNDWQQLNSIDTKGKPGNWDQNSLAYFHDAYEHDSKEWGIDEQLDPKLAQGTDFLQPYLGPEGIPYTGGKDSSNIRGDYTNPANIPSQAPPATKGRMPKGEKGVYLTESKADVFAKVRADHASLNENNKPQPILSREGTRVSPAPLDPKIQALWDTEIQGGGIFSGLSISEVKHIFDQIRKTLKK